MKKASKSLSLVLMSSLTVTLAGCGSDEPSEEYRAYKSIDECVTEAVFTEKECKDMAIAAVKQNPKFANIAECEKEFGEGNCKSYEENGTNVNGERRSSWMPLIAGYMVGRYLGGGSMMQGAQPLYNQQKGAAGTGTSTGAFRTLGGDAVKPDGKGKVATPSQSIRNGFNKTAKPYVSRTGGTSSRGGFSGGRASS